MFEGSDAVALAKAAKAAAKAPDLAKGTAAKATAAEGTTPTTVGHLAELPGAGPVPDAHETVRAKNGQVLTVRRQRSLRDQGGRLAFPFRRRQRLEAANFLSRGELPDAQGAVNADGNDTLAVGME